MDDHQLIERLLEIEAAHSGATSGDREAALERALARLEALADEPQDFQFTLTSRWSQSLFVALARRYRLEPFRRKRQHATTIMLNVKPSFLEDTFMPQFHAIHGELVKHLDEVALKIIEAAVYCDPAETAALASKQLSLPES